MSNEFLEETKPLIATMFRDRPKVWSRKVRSPWRFKSILAKHAEYAEVGAVVDSVLLEPKGQKSFNGLEEEQAMSDAEDPKTIEYPSNTLTRRDLIKGVIVGGVAVSSASYLFRASTLLGQSGRGTGERLLTINVNGQERRADVMKQETLAWTLRHKLGLTGTKLGCDRAECGSCTVLIDGVPHYACSVLTHTVRARKILTIEGLASSDGTLHPVQQGVIDEQGFQCAFCMPGFIMAAVAFLKTNPNPTRSELAQGLSGNLCRCQDYDKILTAMMRGAENLRRASRA